jgi:hypothetical protein
VTVFVTTLGYFQVRVRVRLGIRLGIKLDY